MSSIGSFRVRLRSRLTSHKSRSPPDSAGSGTTTLLLDSPPESEKCCTPYRLPRISPRATPAPGDDSPLPGLDSDSEKVWGRFGYEDNVRMPELGPTINKAQMNSVPSPTVSCSSVTAGARSVAAAGQRHRQQAMMVPQFRTAAITPRPAGGVHVHLLKRVDEASVHVYKSFLDKAAHMEQHPANPAPTPTPTANSRSVSPAKSTRSIHWTLGSTNRHLLFDRKGQSRNQGPYSREFTVRCMAPTNWMRMKWGRQRSMVH